MLDIAFSADRASDVPLPRQLADHVATLIETGRLAAGTKLPATRDVAVGSRLSRKSVAAAYDILAGRGLVTAHVGQGTFVASAALDRGRTDARRLAAGIRVVRALLARRRGRAAAVAPARRARRASVRLPRRPHRSDDVAAAGPPVGVRPHVREPRAAPGDGDAHGPVRLAALRREVARHLTTRGIACEPDEVAITNGLQQAIDLVARALVDPGDAVVVEQPGYFGATLAFRGRGAHFLDVDVDDEGLDTDRLARVLRVRRAKLVYVTPATQCPTGVVLSERRRAALMALADEHQLPIFEDDYDCELRYAGTDAARRSRRAIRAGT
jgi:GntR family transcriptional regulator/MocR family aminotransferase